MEFSINDITMPAPQAFDQQGIISFLTYDKQQAFNALDDISQTTAGYHLCDTVLDFLMTEIVAGNQEAHDIYRELFAFARRAEVA